MSALRKLEFEDQTCRYCAVQSGQRSVSVGITMAFQPIVSLSERRIYAQEALVRGINGESAAEVLAVAATGNIYRFDQQCRVQSIVDAAMRGVDDTISINFMPNAVNEPQHCLRRTVWAAERHGIPLNRLVFEITEFEEVTDVAHLKRIIDSYRALGIRTAIDDFGNGSSGLNLLAELHPDIIKIDRGLVANCDQEPVRRSILRGIVSTAEELGIEVIAEGIEREDEVSALADLGIDLMQGYHFAKPTVGHAWSAAEIFA